MFDLVLYTTWDILLIGIIWTVALTVFSVIAYDTVLMIPKTFKDLMN